MMGTIAVEQRSMFGKGYITVQNLFDQWPNGISRYGILLVISETIVYTMCEITGTEKTHYDASDLTTVVRGP
jgi:hypothetical protein